MHSTTNTLLSAVRIILFMYPIGDCDVALLFLPPLIPFSSYPQFILTLISSLSRPPPPLNASPVVVVVVAAAAAAAANPGSRTGRVEKAKAGGAAAPSPPHCLRYLGRRIRRLRTAAPPAWTRRTAP